MHEVKAFLCGYFTRCYQADFGMMEEQGWVRRQPSKEQIAGLKRVYYREFVDFCFADALSRRGCVELRREVNEPIAFATKCGDVQLMVDDLSLYLMPMDVTLLKIGISLVVDDLNKATAAIGSLRMVDYYTPQTHGEFMRLGVEPLLEQCRALTGSDAQLASALVEPGNKFRVFQIVKSCAPHEADGQSDILKVRGY